MKFAAHSIRAPAAGGTPALRQMPRSGSQGEKVLQQRQPELVALLRVKLRAPDIAALHGGGETVAILRPRQHVRRVVADEVVGMHEVEARLRREVAQQRVCLRWLDEVPAHVRHFERGRLDGAFEPDRVPGNPAEPRQLTFLAAAGEELHAQANAEDGNLPFQHLLVQHGNQPALAQLRHAVVERADAGEDELVRLRDDGGVGGHGEAAARLASHVDNGADVAHAVVNYCYH